MAITDLSELTVAVNNWLAKSYSTLRVYEFIAMAEADLNRRLRIREMEATTDLSLTGGTREVALPTRYLGTRRLYLDGDPVQLLDYMPPVDFWERYTGSQTSKPEAYTIEADNIVFGPGPDTTYTGKHLYWRGFEALDAESGPTTNELLTNHPDLYLYATLKQAFTFKGEPQMVAYWDGLTAQAIRSVEQSSEHDRYPSGQLVRRNDSGHP